MDGNGKNVRRKANFNQKQDISRFREAEINNLPIIAKLFFLLRNL
jgi:hypothetical protein